MKMEKYHYSPVILVKNRPRLCISLLLYVFASLAVLYFLLSDALCFGSKSYTHSDNLSDYVKIDNIMTHMQALETIALNHPNRSRSVMNGYAKSGDYVIHQLKTRTDCDLSTQYFKVPVWEKYSSSLKLDSPYKIEFQDQVDFNLMRYGGQSSNADALTIFKLPNGTNGCSKDHFKDISNNQVVLLDFNSGGNQCEQYQIALNAESFGAFAVLFANTDKKTALSNGRVRSLHWSDGDPLVHIPVFSISYSVGKMLYSLQDNVKLSISTSTSLNVVETFNIICQTKEGNQDNVAMLGAHLDSVPVEGDTGMSDNASGSSALLEVVIQLYETGMNFKLKNGMRFAWWGAEEIGLMGSRHYARELAKSKEEFNKLLVYGNHDMLGSPNYVPFIYRGGSAPEKLQQPSTQLQLLYEEFYSSLPLDSKFHRNFDYSDMTGGSDFYSFLEINIPASGLATGAGGLKTVEQREKFGGLANAPWDPCYHQYCDTLLNISPEVLEVNAKSVAHVTQRLGTMSDIRKVFRRI